MTPIEMAREAGILPDLAKIEKRDNKIAAIKESHPRPLLQRD